MIINKENTKINVVAYDQNKDSYKFDAEYYYLPNNKVNLAVAAPGLLLYIGKEKEYISIFQTSLI